jgi:hypothetical protein
VDYIVLVEVCETLHEVFQDLLFALGEESMRGAKEHIERVGEKGEDEDEVVMVVETRG